MDIQFTKMHGLGNDFVILDTRNGHVPTDETFMRHIAHRRFGIGCDQVIVLYPSDVADIFMKIYNCDGSVAGACGNATRCVASIVMNEKQSFACSIETISDILQCSTDFSVSDGEFISVDMGVYKTAWSDIPILEPMDTSQVILEHQGTPYTGYCVNMGNPHFVCVVPDCEQVDLSVLGAFIEHHPIFPERVNVEFVSVKSDDHIRMRVWERGGMITMACGTGACAVAVACYNQGLTKDSVRISLDGGDLYIRVGEDKRVHMIGPYTKSYQGSIGYEG